MQSKKKTISDVHVALASLEFHVYVTSEYFVCHGVLKKRSNLQQNLENLQKSLRINYATGLFSAEKFARRREFEFEGASTRRSQHFP